MPSEFEGDEAEEAGPAGLERVLFWSGYNAVIAFFVISGFLIASSSLQRWGALDRLRLGEFYRLRAARIVPTLVLLLVVLSALHMAGLADYRIAAQQASLGRAWLAALGLHVNLLEGQRGYLPTTIRPSRLVTSIQRLLRQRQSSGKTR